MARAAEESRRAACYVVFTCKEMLPPKITPDMIGGKLGLPGKEHVTDDSSNIKALENALRRANDTPRWLKSLGQWNLVFDRFMIMVVSCKMFTIVQMLSYRATIHRLAEKLRH